MARICIWRELCSKNKRANPIFLGQRIQNSAFLLI
jgi:hypothetical protein